MWHFQKVIVSSPVFLSSQIKFTKTGAVFWSPFAAEAQENEYCPQGE